MMFGMPMAPELGLIVIGSVPAGALIALILKLAGATGRTTRAIVSWCLLLLFVIVLVSEIALFVVKHNETRERRDMISEAASLGLARDIWSKIRCISGALFVCCSIAHVSLNIRPLISYIRAR